MITIENMKFGDTVYSVKTVNNAFRKNKLTFTDADGNEWYRYDKPNWEYIIEELIYCGKSTYIEEGEVRFDEDHMTQLYFKYPDGQIYPKWEDIEEYENLFPTKAAAEEHIKMKEKENG